MTCGHMQEVECYYITIFEIHWGWQILQWVKLQEEDMAVHCIGTEKRPDVQIFVES